MDTIDVARRTIRALGLKKIIFGATNIYARFSPRHVCVRDGIRYELDLTEVIDQGIWLHGWEPATIRLLKKHVTAGDVVVEVGANVGAHTLLLAKLVGAAGKVYAFEPTVYAQRKLRTNIDLNPELKSRIIVRSELVTNHEHETPVRVIKSSFPIRAGGAPGEAVSAAAIALDSEAFSRVDLLKIDVDGYDYKVLEGAIEILRMFRPRLLVELCEHALTAQGDSVHKLLGLLAGIGYRGFYEDGAPIVSAEQVLQRTRLAASVNGFFGHQ
jgi:FkbM family methyltransferase